MNTRRLSVSLSCLLFLALAGCSGNPGFHRMVRGEWGAVAGRPEVAVLPVSAIGNRLLLEIARVAPETVFANPGSADILVEIRPDDGGHLSLVASRRDTGSVLMTRSWITIDDSRAAMEILVREFAEDFATNLSARFGRGGAR